MLVGLLWILAAIGFLFWFLNGIQLMIGFRLVPKLRDFKPALDDECPRVSILVPACNEAETVETAMRSLLAMDYPNLEIIAIEDRSTDRTGEILDRLAAADPRLRVLHLTELPPGWLGKNHALHTGSAAASGEWLLFTDADVIYEPDALRRVAALLHRRPCDHLVAVPRMETIGFWERTFIPFFLVIFHIRFRTWEAAWKRAPGYVGAGAFNMVRADVYRTLRVHERLRMEVGDDIFLGRLLKRSGYRQLLAEAEESIRVRWAIGLRGVLQVLMKNAFAGHGYSWFSVAFTLVGLTVVALWPYAGLGMGPSGARILCAGTVLTTLLLALFFQRSSRVSFLYALAWPIAALLFLWIILRSSLQAERQKGIIWRGTLYPLEELRKAAAIRN